MGQNQVFLIERWHSFGGSFLVGFTVYIPTSTKLIEIGDLGEIRNSLASIILVIL